jgi:hypothetical protein
VQNRNRQARRCLGLGRVRLGRRRGALWRRFARLRCRHGGGEGERGER